VDVDYLVVAGGGGGGACNGGGGGGAGGYRASGYGPSPLQGSSLSSLTTGTYNITVGAGGAAQLKAGNVKQDAYGSKSSEYYNIGVGSQTGGNFGPSGTGSASAGGSAVNSISASQAQSGNGVTVVDNSTTVTDNSTSASSSNSYTQQVSPRRTNNTGVRQDMVMP